MIAVIDESRCVGCAQCLPPCPVDAIIGSTGQTHTVISQECIGCGLCLPPCPMDCITLINKPNPSLDPTKAKSRHILKRQRMQAQSRRLLPTMRSLPQLKIEITRIMRRKIIPG